MKILFVMVALALFCFWPATIPATSADEKTRQTIGPAAVWEASAQLIEEIKTECADLTDPAAGRCLVSIMKKHGATPEAIAFTALMGNTAYLRQLQSDGRVDVAYVEYPFRPNENQGILLVNGFPRIIDVDDLSSMVKGQLQKDPLYIQLAKEFPAISLWPADRSGENAVVMGTSPRGGLGFIVTYRLLNGCHDCALVGYARFAFEFDSLGNFIGVRLKGVEAKVAGDKGTGADSAGAQADPIEVAVGSDFSITLASNPTTGYRWELAEPLDETLIKLVDSEYKAPRTKLAGAGGREVWTFKGIGQGHGVIELKYVRPWEKDAPPGKTAEFAVRVH